MIKIEINMKGLVYSLKFSGKNINVKNNKYLNFVYLIKYKEKKNQSIFVEM